MKGIRHVPRGTAASTSWTTRLCGCDTPRIWGPVTAKPLLPARTMRRKNGSKISVSSNMDSTGSSPGPETESALPSDAEVVSPVSRSYLLPSADARFEGMKVLVAGATGGVGKAVVKQLVDQGIECRALVRDGLKASRELPSTMDGMQIMEGNVYNYRDCARAVEGCNAVICCTGPTDRFDPLQPFKVDFEGNSNLAAAAKAAGVKKFVLVTSIGVDDVLFPLNLLWGVLFWKKQGELAVQRSGLDYTILRPGGLVTESQSGRGEGGLMAGPPDTFGLPPRRRPGSILRSLVAEGCIAALVTPEARCKIVEVIQSKEEPNRPWAEVFASVQ